MAPLITTTYMYSCSSHIQYTINDIMLIESTIPYYIMCSL